MRFAWYAIALGSFHSLFVSFSSFCVPKLYSSRSLEHEAGGGRSRIVAKQAQSEDFLYLNGFHK